MARISELHYSNAYAKSSGVSEFVEVALKPGEDPADFTVGLYKADGMEGLAVRLDDPGVVATYDADADEFVYVVSSDVFPFVITDPDGRAGDQNYEAISLVETSPGGGVIDFYDIGGGTTEIYAQDGVASGATSKNIPTPTEPDTSDYTLQFNVNSPDEVTYAPVDPGDTGAICFCAGTRILTPKGMRAVEQLRVGDRVLTRDSGAQQITWIGRTSVAGRGLLAPVRLARGVLGAERPLLVSPQHRLLLTGASLEMLTGEGEVLCAARHLERGAAIRRVSMARVTYLHLLFARHEVIWAEGVMSESFYLGPGSVAAMGPDMTAEFDALFPGKIEAARAKRKPERLARHCLHPWEAALLRQPSIALR